MFILISLNLIHLSAFARGIWISCSAYWTDERFNLGNIKDQTIKEIWYGNKRREHLKFILEELDINECRKTCHPDKDNQYLHIISGLSNVEFDKEIDRLKIIPAPKRVNFI